MSEAAFRPGVDSYSAAFAACVAGGREEEAVGFLGQMSAVYKAALVARPGGAASSFGGGGSNAAGVTETNR